MDLSVNSIPSTSIAVDGGVEMNNELKEKVKDLHVKFHGDFVLPSNPTTFEEAVKIYKELPNFVVGGKCPKGAHESVPVSNEKNE